MNRHILEKLKSEGSVKDDSIVVPFKSIKTASMEYNIPEKSLEIMLLEEGLIPERYARNIGTYGIFGQLLLLKSKVMVVGCGGLGAVSYTHLMAMKYLGETVDIHGGGSDLIFPHHENEIAQAEAATGKQFVRYWVHNGYLLINKEKMSKSLGNILTVREIIKKYQPLAVRLFILGAHYRSPLDFSDESLTQATRSLQRLRNCYSDLMFHLERSQEKDVPDTWLNDIVDEGYGRFCEALDDAVSYTHLDVYKRQVG